MNIPDWIVNNNQTIIIIFVLAILIYLAYILWWSGGNTNRIEGFQENEISDLLDKIRVNIYQRESIWNNKFYNNQQGRKEKPLSFWHPQESQNIRLPSGIKILGTCVSESTNYDAPMENTMLVAGDVKTPISAVDLFKFGHNELTRPRLDRYGKPLTHFALKDINELQDVDNRILILQDYISNLNSVYEEYKSILNEIQSEINNYTKFDIIAYGPESYFKNVVFSDKIINGQTISIPKGEYQSMRVPIGSSGTLVFKDGTTDTFSYPFEGIINKTNPDEYIDKITYENIIASNADIQKWMITGQYGLGFLNSSNPNKIFNRGSSSYSYSTSLNYGFGDATTDPEYVGLYAHGKSDLLDYFANKQPGTFPPPNTKPYNPQTDIILAQINRYNNYYFVITPKTEDISTFGNKYRHDPKDPINKKVYYSPHLTRIDNEILLFDINNKQKQINDVINSFVTTNNNWYFGNTNLNVNTNTILSCNQHYIDIAFRMHTKKKKLRSDGIICPSGLGCNCCNIRDDKWVSLTAGGIDHGPVVSATVTLNFPENKIPYYRLFTTIRDNDIIIIENELTKANRQLAQLYDFKTLINNNGLEPYPLRIIRPNPPSGYVSLGDIVFNHLDGGYTAKKPIIDNFGCVPKQCVREMRDWLVTDKVFEYNRNGKYLGIFKNPYLQTIRATTAAGILPPGKVEKVVACVEKCRLVDDIINSDTCARKFYKANKGIIEATNLDNDNVVLNRESVIYKDKIRERQDKITELQDVARKLQLQDDKAEIVNREYNRNKLQNLINKQRVNIAHLSDRLNNESSQVDINLGFDYAKFVELIYKLPETVSEEVKKKIIDIVDIRAGEKLSMLPDETVTAILAECPTPDTEGLVRKSLVESGCYGCSNLQ